MTRHASLNHTRHNQIKGGYFTPAAPKPHPPDGLIIRDHPPPLEPRAEALRQAQLAMKKKYPEPYYWGAFICQGDSSPLSRSVTAITG